MRRISLLLTAVALCLFATSSLFAQDWKGNGRLTGVVVDNAGKPVKGAKVSMVGGGGTGPAGIVTDGKGKFSFLGLRSGTWTITAEADGYVPTRQSAEVMEGQLRPPVKIALEPLPPPAPAAPEAVPDVASSVPPEAVEAVRKGENLLKQAEGQPVEGEVTMSMAPGDLTPEQKKELYKQAIAEFEKAQALIPDNLQLKQVLAQAYYKTGDLKQATALLQQVYDGDPSNTGVLLLLVNLLLENGQLDEGKALLEKVPAGTMTDPTALINIGILFMNKSRLDDAYAYFDKAVTLDPTRGETYYYRGLASLQKQKMAAAKADLQKVVELAPDSSEAKDAQDLLKQMK